MASSGTTPFPLYLISLHTDMCSRSLSNVEFFYLIEASRSSWNVTSSTPFNFFEAQSLSCSYKLTYFRFSRSPVLPVALDTLVINDAYNVPALLDIKTCTTNWRTENRHFKFRLPFVGPPTPNSQIVNFL